jgi:hypothetical protein
MNSEWYSGRFRKLDPQTGYLLVSMFATGNLSIGFHLFLFIEMQYTDQKVLFIGYKLRRSHHRIQHPA